MDFIDVEAVKTFAGAVALVVAITQVIKNYIPKVDPKYISLVLSFVVMFGILFIFSKDFTVAGIFLCVLNSLLVSGAAVGLFEYAIKPIQRITENNEDA